MNQSINMQDSISISDSISLRVESGHLRVSHQDTCREILKKQPLENGDIIDFFISLHIVLEVSLNALFRHITSAAIKKELDEFEVLRNLDNISYIDKTILFIYNSSFNFENNIKDASKFHSIINTMRDFSGVRNKLLHGHTISSISDHNGERNSELKKLLNEDFLQDQIKKYKFIVEGLAFFLIHLETNIPLNGKSDFINTFLSTDFLDISK